MRPALIVMDPPASIFALSSSIEVNRGMFRHSSRRRPLKGLAVPICNETEQLPLDIVGGFEPSSLKNPGKGK